VFGGCILTCSIIIKQNQSLIHVFQLSMSATLQDVEVTEAGGEKSKRDAVFIRGNMIRYFYQFILKRVCRILYSEFTPNVAQVSK